MNSLINKFNNNGIVNENDILNISSKFIHENKLEEYLKDVKFNNTINDIAVYSPLNSIIYINMQKLWETCYKWTNKLQASYKIDNNNYSYFLNFFVLYILFHEITHAIQKMKHDKNCNNTDSVYIFLYELCEKLEIENRELYNKNHNLFPMEIEANNNGLLKAYNFMSHTNVPNHEKRIMHLQYISSLLSNYERVGKNHIITPFNKLYILENRINISKLNELLETENLDEIERLNLGLDIKINEYKSLQKEKVRLLIKR